MNTRYLRIKVAESRYIYYVVARKGHGRFSVGKTGGKFWYLFIEGNFIDRYKTLKLARKVGLTYFEKG